MKKTLTIAIASLSLLLSACGSSTDTHSSSNSNSSESSSSSSSSSSKQTVKKSVQVMQNTSETKLHQRGAINAQNLRYGELIKTNDHYAKPYSIEKGEVLQAVEDSDSDATMLLVYTDDNSDQLFKVYTPEKTKAIAEDYVSLNGVLDEINTYDTQSGGSNTVPVLLTKNITVLGHDDGSY